MMTTGDSARCSCPFFCQSVALHRPAPRYKTGGKTCSCIISLSNDWDTYFRPNNCWITQISQATIDILCCFCCRRVSSSRSQSGKTSNMWACSFQSLLFKEVDVRKLDWLVSSTQHHQGTMNNNFMLSWKLMFSRSGKDGNLAELRLNRAIEEVEEWTTGVKSTIL